MSASGFSRRDLLQGGAAAALAAVLAACADDDASPSTTKPASSTSSSTTGLVDLVVDVIVDLDHGAPDDLGGTGDDRRAVDRRAEPGDRRPPGPHQGDAC